MINLMMKKSVLLAIMMVITAMMLVGCIYLDEQAEETVKVETTKAQEDNMKDVEIVGNPVIQMEMADGGTMIFELYPEYAPETVKNFVGLVESGFYDGLKFHRIIKGFMAQGGDPKGDGTGGASTNITGEFAQNGFDQNALKHTKGVISMARSQNPNSASSQFFIMDGEGTFLDGQYAAFGMMTEGEEILETIMNTEVEKNQYDELSAPKKEVVIRQITMIK